MAHFPFVAELLINRADSHMNVTQSANMPTSAAFSQMAVCNMKLPLIHMNGTNGPVHLCLFIFFVW